MPSCQQTLSCHQRAFSFFLSVLLLFSFTSLPLVNYYFCENCRELVILAHLYFCQMGPKRAQKWLWKEMNTQRKKRWIPSLENIAMGLKVESSKCSCCCKGKPKPIKDFKGVKRQKCYSCWYVESIRCSFSPRNIRAAHKLRCQENICFILGLCWWPEWWLHCVPQGRGKIRMSQR